jgi:hypothetical protein
MYLAVGNGRLRSAILFPCLQAPSQVPVRKGLFHICGQIGIPEQEGIKTSSQDVSPPLRGQIGIPEQEGIKTPQCGRTRPLQSQIGIPEQEGIKTFSLSASFLKFWPNRYP